MQTDHTPTQKQLQNIPYGYCQCGCGQKTRIAPQSHTREGWVKGEPLRYIQGHNNPHYNSVVDYFWSRVTPGMPDECWLWQGFRNPQGYGQFNYHKKAYRVPRLCWEIHFGAIPEGLWVLHRCDNPPCCNPNHLFLGTPTDNAQDMIQKGRRVITHGEDHPFAKLTNKQAKEIRSMYATGMYSQRKLSGLFGVSTRVIWGILQRRTYARSDGCNNG